MIVTIIFSTKLFRMEFSSYYDYLSSEKMFSVVIDTIIQCTEKEKKNLRDSARDRTGDLECVRLT